MLLSSEVLTRADHCHYHAMFNSSKCVFVYFIEYSSVLIVATTPKSSQICFILVFLSGLSQQNFLVWQKQKRMRAFFMGKNKKKRKMGDIYSVGFTVMNRDKKSRQIKWNTQKPCKKKNKSHNKLFFNIFFSDTFLPLRFLFVFLLNNLIWQNFLHHTR